MESFVMGVCDWLLRKRVKRQSPYEAFALAEPEDHLRTSGYIDFIGLFAKGHTRLSALRLLARVPF